MWAHREGETGTVMCGGVILGRLIWKTVLAIGNLDIYIRRNGKISPSIDS